MKIGIYAGSFNPIHNAHLDIAVSLLDRKIVDKVVFVPAGDEYEKSNLIGGEHRLEMIERIIKKYDNIDVSDVEVKRGKMYTYETLDYFKEKYNGAELYFVMGSDNLSEFHLWKKWEYVLNTYKLIVFLRNNQTKDEFKQYVINKNVLFIEYNYMLSSSEIRKSIKDKKYNELIGKIDDSVISYIKEHDLYE